VRGHALARLGPVVAALLCAAPAAGETLGEALRARGARVTAETVPDAGISIISYTVLRDRQAFVIVYYRDQGTSALVPPLFVGRLDRVTGRWAQAAIDEQAIRPAPSACLGSALSVRKAARMLLIETHVNPSAGCTLVVAENLAVRDVLPGWPVAVFADGRVVYQHSQPHFVAVHPLEVSIYDPRTRTHRAVYPPRPAPPLRLEHMRKLETLYTPDWCQARNHPCDPERFDERVEGPVEASDRTGALAFVAAFENIVFAEDGAPPAGGPAGRPTEVLYVFRRLAGPGPPEVREILFAEARRRFGGTRLKQYVEPATLDRIFGP
jgi:hypothetical protein